ncbi:MAG TPA: tRNA dihydrouridine synthase DusB [Dissulfurispiraceae bacterium]|nr:tRNA dihydrouridine synthase DusB [Dissulfurispiraceae bacterium]
MIERKLESVNIPSSLEIGSLQLAMPLILAPMAGISDLPFRAMHRRYGCNLAFTEMISARSLAYGSRQTLSMLSMSDLDRPLGVQLLGNDPDVLVRTLDIIHTMPFSLIDINAACPVPKVTSRGEGAGLLREDPKRIETLVGAVVRATHLPVTIKIRTGWDDDSLVAVSVAHAAEAAGASAICVHGRTRMQHYGGRVNREAIAEVKRTVKIPVIASGDAFSPRLIQRTFEETGCDGVMIARGALGNPWVFRDVMDYLSTGMCGERRSLAEIAAAMHDHLALCCEYYGERGGTVLFRKFFTWYAKGIKTGRQYKERVFSVTEQAAMKAVIDELEQANLQVLPLYEAYDKEMLDSLPDSHRRTGDLLQWQ